MKIRIKTTAHMPEVPQELEMEDGTLRDLLVRLFSGGPVLHMIIDRKTGEMKPEGLFEIALNDVLHNNLSLGLDTPLCEGDTVRLSMILLGGG